MNDMPEPTEQEELETLATAIQELQRATNKIVRRRELSATFHPLNVLDIGLFNLQVVALLAVRTTAKTRGGNHD